jgi:hypothetical protein
MKWIGRFGPVLLLVVVLASMGAAPVMAATAPPNDTFANAAPIATLPFTQTLDTSAATTDAVDVEANSQCGAPATAASVWYDYTPADDGAIVVDVSQSGFEAGVIVVTGDPGSFILQGCGPGAVGLPVYANTTYHIMAFSDTASVNGGVLKISVDVAPPPPTISLTVNPVGRVDKTGAALLTGTFTCTGEAIDGIIDIQLSQRVGRFIISGESMAMIPACDGTTYPWSLPVYSQNGKFAGGKAASVTWAYACGEVFCGEGYVEQKVQLKR